MPPAIADSDDDGDDFVFPGNGQGDNAGAGNEIAGGEGAIATYDGTHENSTGSTERLRRQILSAERGLITQSTSLATKASTGQPSSGSPSMAAMKRRHTSVFGSGSAESPEKSVKRTKTTLKPYGAKRGAPVDEESELAPTTSQLPRFSDHSGVRPSAELPAGSFQDDFVNHEPAVLFRDTGSTVEDTSSAQQRLLQQNLGGRKGSTTSAVVGADAEQQQSSSLAGWTPSEQTHSAESNTFEKQRDDAESHEVEQLGSGAANGENANPNSSLVRGIISKLGNAPHLKDNGTHERRTGADIDSLTKPQASPAVEVLIESWDASASPAALTTSTSKAGRARKSRAELEDKSEPLNSDDKAIGLPKERYVPRPSRRRATQIVEEPIDYSVRPEKTAKSKRTKTTGAAVSPLDGGLQQAKSPTGEPAVNSQSSKHHEKPPNEKGAKLVAPIPDDPEANKVALNTDSKAIEDTSEVLQKPASKKVGIKPTTADKSDDAIFVKPPKPTPKPKATSKAKRSHTTIFEDHVEFMGSQRSLSLSQQQAKRKSALQDVQNEATKTSQRKRKTIVSDDEDEQDELAKNPDDDVVEEDEPPPKKRGKGRPAKAKAKPQPKSAEKVFENSEGESDEEAELDEAPKKRGRGRPSKAGAEAPLRAKEAIDEPSTASKHVETPLQPLTGVDKAVDQSNEPPAPSPKPSSAKEMPTPSPEKVIETPAPTPQKATKSDPNSHSPIKNSSKVALRVGLSRRHRIPSLLRTMKPPTKR